MISVNDIGKRPPTFADASVLAQAIIESGYNFSHGDIYFNWFKYEKEKNYDLTVEHPLISRKFSDLSSHTERKSCRYTAKNWSPVQAKLIHMIV